MTVVAPNLAERLLVDLTKAITANTAELRAVRARADKLLVLIDKLVASGQATGILGTIIQAIGRR